jgi:predicted enzyme related to lactoylglutathione lyase
VEAAERAGGTVVVPPMDAGDSGAFAVLEDPAGAMFGLWRSGVLTGFDVVDEPGAVVWCETLSDEPEAARAFYAEVFGHTYRDMSGPGFVYASFEVDGRTAGGIGGLSAGMGVGHLPHWSVYFSVEDVDAAAAAVVRHGGTVTREPWDSAFGRVALVTGPADEAFALHAELGAAVAEGQVSADPA